MDKVYSDRCEYIVGLDIGSSSAKCMVGELSDECNLKVIGAGEIEMAGDIDNPVLMKENSNQIKTLISRIEEETELNIYTVYSTVGRGEVRGLNMTGSISLKGSRIKKKHCQKVLKSAEKLSIPHGLEIVHVLPQKFYIDGQKKVVDPVGFTADMLEVELHVITCDSKSMNMKRKLVQNAGYFIEGMVIDSLASFYGGRGLYSREKDVLIVNTGARNTDVLFFVDGQVLMSAQIFFGIDDIINEFEYRFGITEKDARKLMSSYVSFSNSHITHPKKIDNSSFRIVQKKVSASDGTYYNDYKKISEHTISLVNSYMMSQMVEKIKSEIIGYLKGDINNIQTVLMGGAAYLPETEKMFSEKFGCEVIIGENRLRSGGDLFGTAYGLLRYGVENRGDIPREKQGNIFKRSLENLSRLRSWANVRLT